MKQSNRIRTLCNTECKVVVVQGLPHEACIRLGRGHSVGLFWGRLARRVCCARLQRACMACVPWPPAHVQGACFRAYVWFQKKKQEEEAARTAAEAEGAAGQPRAQAAPGAKAAVAGAKAAVAAAAADAGNDGDDDGEPAAGARRRTRRAA